MQENLYREKDGQLSFVPVPDSKYKDTYSYHGPVFIFGKTVAHVKLKTQAVSFAKAYSNFVWQVKKELGYQPTSNFVWQVKKELGYQPISKVTISKNLIKKEELKYGKSV